MTTHLLCLHHPQMEDNDLYDAITLGLHQTDPILEHPPEKVIWVDDCGGQVSLNSSSLALEYVAKMWCCEAS